MDKLFKTKDGKTVTWQLPNIPIILWFVFTVIARVSRGDISDHAAWIAFGAIVCWAILEIFLGVNTFRKLLGSFILSAVIINKFFL